TVGAYNANKGNPINPTNANLITGLHKPTGLAISGNTLFVSSFITPRPVVPPAVPEFEVAAYNASTGAPVSGFTPITGLTRATGLAVAGNTLFVASFGVGMGHGTVGSYNVATGAAINPNLIPNLNAPTGLIATGNLLFVSKETGGTVDKY